ncbi:hypothetical protein GCM10022224_092020 [Nonomuraea antimicrobica]|uniref:Uncharacterized protein n=1 Tax=Nonomuraea antimicrobica TaxID=561173 RepID=A0ABP7E4J6_9ACTN
MTSTPQLSLSISPHLTVLAMLTDALAGRRRGLPDRWRETIASRVARPGHQAVRPFAAPGHSVAPDCLVPHAPVAGDVSVQEQFGALRELPPGRLAADLEQAFGPGPLPVHWRSAAERPAAWLHGYAGALSDIWNTVEPLWKRARPLLDREIRRVGVAAVRGGPELLLGALTDRITCVEGGLCIADVEASSYELGDRKIVLVPRAASGWWTSRAWRSRSASPTRWRCRRTRRPSSPAHRPSPAGR